MSGMSYGTRWLPATNTEIGTVACAPSAPN